MLMKKFRHKMSNVESRGDEKSGENKNEDTYN